MGWAVVCLNVRPSEKKSVCVRERKGKNKTMCKWGKALSTSIMGNTYSLEFSSRTRSGYNTRELWIVRALKTDGFISGKKKSGDGGEM